MLASQLTLNPDHCLLIDSRLQVAVVYLRTHVETQPKLTSKLTLWLLFNYRPTLKPDQCLPIDPNFCKEEVLPRHLYLAVFPRTRETSVNLYLSYLIHVILTFYFPLLYSYHAPHYVSPCLEACIE